MMKEHECEWVKKTLMNQGAKLRERELECEPSQSVFDTLSKNFFFFDLKQKILSDFMVFCFSVSITA